MVNGKRLRQVIVGWFLLYFIVFILKPTTNVQVLGITALQQVWLIIGSLVALNNTSILNWKIGEMVTGIVVGFFVFASNITVNFIIITTLNQVFGYNQVTYWLLQEQKGVRLLLEGGSTSTYWVVALLLVIGAPLGEELFFRGAFLGFLTEVTSSKWALFISALCFALVHSYVIQFIPVFLSGLIFGLVFMKRKNILSPLVAHITANLISLFFYMR